MLHLDHVLCQRCEWNTVGDASLWDADREPESPLTMKMVRRAPSSPQATCTRRDADGCRPLDGGGVSLRIDRCISEIAIVL